MVCKSLGKETNCACRRHIIPNAPRGVQNNWLTEKTDQTEEKLTEKTEPK